jgi:hypothetical protein
VLELPKKQGQQQLIFYFDACGSMNTEKTLELAIERAQQLELQKLVVASETGLSALKAVELLEESELQLVVVTSAAGTRIKGTAIGDLKIGIPDSKIWQRLVETGATVIRATDPLYNVGAVFEHQRIPTLGSLFRQCLRLVSSGTAVCVGVVLMATDNGILHEGEEVVAAAGSWVGLDTAVVVSAANSVHLFERGKVEIREIICKPRSPSYTWPVNQKDWVGDLTPYKRFTD